jgi:hypothetical protein
MQAAEEEKLAAITDAIGGNQFAAVRLCFACGGTARLSPESLLLPSFACPTVVASVVAGDGDAVATSSNLRPGFLVGVIWTDERGGLYLCDPKSSRVHNSTSRVSPDEPGPQNARLVIAPPPSPRYFDSLVLARDWRRLPVSPSQILQSDGCPGIYEVLLSDLVVLSESPKLALSSGTEIQTLGSIDADCRETLNVQAYVRCKSAVLAGRSRNPVFLVELGSGDDGAEETVVTVIFSGCEAMRWWPFVCPGHFLRWIGLTVVSLPSKGNRRVLRAAGPKVLLLSAERLSGMDRCTLPGAVKNANERLESASVPKSVALRNEDGISVPMQPETSTGGRGHREKPSRGSFGRVVTYKGEVTKVLADGRFELDHSIMLHLGARGGWCAGPEAISVCFREGAQVVVVEALVAYRRGRPAALFPTCRTLAYVAYFGALPACRSGLPAHRSFRESPWRALWKILSPSQILWAEELYASLSAKFGLWCTSQSLDDDEVVGRPSQGTGSVDFRLVEALLGSKSEDGLILHVMRMHSAGRSTVDQERRTDVYDEFLVDGSGDVKWTGASGQSTNLDYEDYPVFPTTADMINSCDVLHVAFAKSGRSAAAAAAALDSPILAFHAWTEGDIGGVLAGKQPPRMGPYDDVGRGESQRASEPCVATHRAVRFVDARRGASTVTFSTLDKNQKLTRPSLTFPLEREFTETGKIRGCRECRKHVSTSLMGCLDSTPDSNGALRLIDATGSLDVLPLGGLSPRFVGVVVSVSTFAMLSVRDVKGSARRTVIFDAPSLEIVIDSGCAPVASKTENPSQLRSQYSIRKLDRHNPSIVCSQAALQSVPCDSLEKAGDERPVVALYVTKVTVRAWGPVASSYFCIRGRLLAWKRSRKHPVWSYLGDAKRGFLECVLKVNGDLAASLHNVVERHCVYEVTCTQLEGIVDAHSWVWNCERLALRDKVFSHQCAGSLEVQLNTGDDANRIWLRQMDAAEISGDCDTEEEQSVVEAAVECWQRGDGAADSRAKPLLDVTALCSRSPLRGLTCCFRIRGIIIGLCASTDMRSRTSHCIEVPLVSHLLIRDCAIPVVEVRVDVTADVILPSGLFPGLVIELCGIVLMEDKRVAQLGFARSTCFASLSSTSSIRVLSSCIASLFERSPSVCCQRPWASRSVLSAMPYERLWCYTRRARADGEEGPRLGWVSVIIQSIRSVRLVVQDAVFGHVVCNFCGEGEVTLEAELIADVVDGSSTGRMLCRGLRNVLDALSAGQLESLALRKGLLQAGSVEFHGSSWLGGVPAATAPPYFEDRSAQTAVVEILSRLARSACRNAIALVKPRRDEVEVFDDTVNLTGLIHLGHGKKLVTAIADSAHCADVECLALIENGAWFDNRVDSDPGDDHETHLDHVSALDLVKRHVAALQK